MSTGADRIRSDDLFKLAIESSPFGVLIAEPSGTIAFVNARLEQEFGYAHGELIGQQVEVLLPESFRASHVEFRSAYLREPGERPMGAGRELVARCRDGSTIPVEIGLNPIYMQKRRVRPRLRREHQRAPACGQRAPAHA